MACSLRLYDDGISFRVVLSQSFWLRVLPAGAPLVQPWWMPERRILGGGRTGGVSLWPFSNSSGWWRLISSLFFTRTSCHKTTHANSYYGAWPGWAVSISVLPLTIPFLKLIFSSSSLYIWSSYCEKALATASGLSSLPPSDVVSNILPQSSLPSLSTTSFSFISLLSLTRTFIYLLLVYLPLTRM